MAEKVKHDSYADYELGDVGTRFIAIIIDGIVLGMITAFLFGTAGGVGGGIGVVATVVYNWLFWTRYNGQTPGKRLTGLRVIKVDGSELSDTDAMLRAVSYYISGILGGLGYIWALFDSQNRGWHDMIAGTLVVKA